MRLCNGVHHRLIHKPTGLLGSTQEAVLALVILIAHRTDSGAESWLEALGERGHLAHRIDPERLPVRPAILDAVLVDPELPANTVEALRRWAGGRVAVRLTNAPDDEWLSELVRTASVPLQLDDCRIDLRRGVVQRDGNLIALTDTEALLLAWLATQTGTVVSRGDLLQNVWGYRATMRTRVVDVTIARLRTKIEADPSNPAFIITVRGKGYRLDGIRVIEEATVRTASGLVGRTVEWDALHRWFDGREPLLTLLGPPGIGKTALAHAFYEQVPGAVWCALQPAASDEEARSVIGAALGLKGAMSNAQIRQAVLYGERPLLVLDNGEHLHGFIGQLLNEAPASPILLTSRLRLGVPSERCLDLVPLTSAATQQLFLQRARLARVDFSSSPQTIAELARLCEGLPLAVELAAAQVGILSGEDLIPVLSRGGVRAKRSGHQTYEDALASSWSLLDTQQQQLLTVLASLRGDVPFRLLDALFDEPLEDLKALVDASLVRILHPPAGSVVHLLDTVRRFTTRNAPLSSDAQLTIATQICTAAEHEAFRAHGAEGWDAVKQLGRARMAIAGAIDTAVQAGDIKLGARLALCLTPYLQVFGAEASDHLLLQKVGADGPKAFEISWLRGLLLAMADPDQAERCAQRCEDLASCPSERAEATFVRTMIDLRRNQLDTSALEAVFDDLNTPMKRHRAHGAIGLARIKRLEPIAALEHLEAGIAIVDRLGIGWAQLQLVQFLPGVYRDTGEIERAARAAKRVARTYEGLGFRGHAEMAITMRRTALHLSDDLAGATRLHLQLMDLMRQQGRTWTVTLLHVALASYYLNQGLLDAVKRTVHDGARLFRAASRAEDLGRLLVFDAAADLALGKEVRSDVLPLLDSRDPSTHNTAIELLVFERLTAGDTEGAAADLEQATASPTHRGLLQALIAAVAGSPVPPPEPQHAADDYRAALGSLVGGPAVVARSERARAILGQSALCFPESRVVAGLRSSASPSEG